MDYGPIFIGGLERSGTSLLYALLASHPSIAMTRRTNLWTYFYQQYGDLSQSKNFDRCLTAMMRYKRLLLLKPNPDRIRHEFWQGEPTYARLFALLEEHFAEQLGRPRWGDKSLNTERYADPIFAAYPNARILHMIRDPRDRYSSTVTRWKVSRGGAGAGTAMWLSSINFAERNLKKYPDRYKVVRYESLVDQPEKILQEICTFIGEEYTSVMLTMRGAETFRDEGGNSSYGQHEPGRISTKSIGRFRQVMSRPQIAFLQLFARREMLAYHYPLEELHFTLGEKISFYFWYVPINLMRLIAWRLREAFLNKTGRTLPSYRIVTEPEVAKASA